MSLKRKNYPAGDEIGAYHKKYIIHSDNSVHGEDGIQIVKLKNGHMCFDVVGSVNVLLNFKGNELISTKTAHKAIVNTDWCLRVKPLYEMVESIITSSEDRTEMITKVTECMNENNDFSASSPFVEDTSLIFEVVKEGTFCDKISRTLGIYDILVFHKPNAANGNDILMTYVMQNFTADFINNTVLGTGVEPEINELRVQSFNLITQTMSIFERNYAFWFLKTASDIL